MSVSRLFPPMAIIALLYAGALIALVLAPVVRKIDRDRVSPAEACELVDRSGAYECVPDTPQRDRDSAKPGQGAGAGDRAGAITSTPGVKAPISTSPESSGAPPGSSGSSESGGGGAGGGTGDGTGGGGPTVSPTPSPQPDNSLLAPALDGLGIERPQNACEDLNHLSGQAVC